MTGGVRRAVIPDWTLGQWFQKDAVIRLVTQHDVILDCRRRTQTSSNKPIRRLHDLHARHSVARAAAAVLSACLCTHALGQTATAGGNGAAPGGIWKAAMPPTQMKGEFDNFDPIGIAAGARIKADCSINWIDPDDGARYCFSSGTSLEFFLDGPQASIARARAGWLELNH
jgi:hypothetical protein